MDTKIINGIRSLALDMIHEAGNGHPGICLDAAPIIYTLFANHLNFNKDDGKWINRDRFILSSHHASALLYSTLFYSGYNIEIEDLKKYRKKFSKLPEYPEINHNLGIELTTGHFGEGFASSIGVVVAEEYLKNILSKDLIDYYTYVLVTTADLMEGISYETASLAGSLKLGKLIVLYDSNNITADGKTDSIFEEDVLKRFESFGWHTELVQNGESIESIDKAIEKAKLINDKPSIIKIKTILGIGSTMAGTNKIYSGSLKEDELNLIKEKMNISKVPFYISKEAVMSFREKIDQRTSVVYNEWVTKYNNILENDEQKKKILMDLEDKNIKLNLKNLQVHFDENIKEDMRTTNKNLMNIISKYLPLFMGGSADAFSKTKTYIDSEEDFKSNNLKGRNIFFGVRENAMSAILNGIAATGLRPFGSTLLARSDYMKPSIRLTSLMNLPVTYIFTYDLLKTEENILTHYPIEQLANLRTIPNMYVFRPADVNELVGSWNYIISKKKPSSLIIPKENKSILKGTSIDAAEKGAYIVKQERGRLSGIIIATGSELETAIEISDELDTKGIITRVISMPSIEVFNNQSDEYKRILFPIGAKVIVIEASNDPAWNEFVYNKKYLLTLNNFSINANTKETLEHINFNFDALLERTEKLLK